MNLVDTGKSFFMSKEEREALKQVNLQVMRAQYISAAEDATKSAKRTAEAYKELQSTVGSDDDLKGLLESCRKNLSVPF